MLKIQHLRKLKKNQFVKKLFLDFNIPAHISKNFITVNNFELKFNEKKSNYLNQCKDDNTTVELISTAEFKLVDERIDGHRKQIVPWLDSVKSLKGLRILEIGCGKGSSTVAFAEQGAIVTAIDVNENYLSDAKIRCELYGLDVKFHLMNASEVHHFFKDEIFDMVIFMASLEHMTLDERIQSMKSTYEMLPKGGLWCIIGTPNRLHFLDSHTSHIPFFHWLPDQLAIKYSQFSSRDEYKENINDIDDVQEKLLQFYRWGRGVSFHEIELAIEPLSKLKIKSNKAQYLRGKNWLYFAGSKSTPNYKYEAFLSRLYPDIHSCFFQPYLDLIIEKV